MHKYYLSFQDENLENQYQYHWQLGERFDKYSIYMKGCIIGFIGKCITHVLDGNMKQLCFSMGFLGFVLLQFLCMRKTNQYMRRISMVSNFLMTIYFQLIDDNTDPVWAHLKGANQMGALFLFILMSEFPEALIQICAMVIIRIVYLILRSTTVQCAPIITLLTFSVVWSYVLYEFHKKARFQFLKTRVNEQWDNIFRQLLGAKSYVLLNFHEENIAYEEIISNNLNSCFQSMGDLQEFLQEALYNKQPLKDYIHQKIQQYNKVQLDQFNNEIQVKFGHYLADVELSIFFGTKPTILLVFPHRELIKNKQYVYLNFIGSLLKRMKNKFIMEIPYSKLVKKIKVAQILERIHDSKPMKLDLINLISQAFTYFPFLKIQVFSPEQLEVETIEETMTLFFLTVLQYTLIDNVKIFIFMNRSQIPEIKFKGKFKSKKILRVMNQYKSYFYRTINTAIISREKISITLYDEVLIPFKFSM